MNTDHKIERPVRVGLISLGCAKNLVDAEIMLGALDRDGVEITNDASLADVVIVNTCSFIDAAQEESVDTILESAQIRESQNRGQGLIVAGCLPQRFRVDLPKLLPEVDAFMGIDQTPQVTEIVHQALAHRAQRLATVGMAKSKSKKGIVASLAALHSSGPERPEGMTGKASPAGNTESKPVENKAVASVVNVSARPVYIPDYATPRFRLTPRHFAYVKIAEGCNHPCSFCIIPRIRGTHRSRAQADVVREARQLIASGVRELNLISQDTTYYGLDLRRSRRVEALKHGAGAAGTIPVTAAESTTLCTLLRELNDLPGQFWIRLLYTHPAHWTEELIRTIADCPKVARYVDIPLQHIHAVMLERMRRETRPEYIKELLAKIRAGIPGIAVRTTFIVGFPGETDAYFQTLLDFIQTSRFERLGIFTYSREEGTRAGKMAGQVAEETKKLRRDLAMAAQLKVATQVAESFVGRVITVLVEQEASAKELQQARVSSWEHGLVRDNDRHQGVMRGRRLKARGEADAPDIDGRVYIGGELPLGEFARVKVAGHTDYDLIAEPA